MISIWFMRLRNMTNWQSPSESECDENVPLRIVYSHILVILIVKIFCKRKPTRQDIRKSSISLNFYADLFIKWVQTRLNWDFSSTIQCNSFFLFFFAFILRLMHFLFPSSRRFDYLCGPTEVLLTHLFCRLKFIICRK